MAFAGAVSEMREALKDTFGADTIYAPAAGSPVAVRAISFQDDYERADAGEAGVQSTCPMVAYKLSDLPVDPKADDPRITNVETGRVYRVTEAQTDSRGGVRLLLHRTS